MPIRRQFKNVVNNYTDSEVKVREATSNDPWGPSSSLMAEIADSTYNVMEFGQVMGMIWRRLNDHGRNWRHVYKALVLLDYLIKTGSERVYQQCREHVFTIQTLKDFQFVDKDGKDQGVNVREKAKQLVALLKDDDRLKLEREKAMKARERFAQANQAVSSQTMHAQFGRESKKNSTATTGAMSLETPPSFPGQAVEPPVQLQPVQPQPASIPSTTATTGIEQARPTDSVDEDMQLRLALALSKQQAEHDQELRYTEEQRVQQAMAQSARDSRHQGNPTLLDVSGAQSNNQGTGFENDFVANDPWSAPSRPTQRDPWLAQPLGKTKWESMDTPFGTGPTLSPKSAVAPPVDEFDMFDSRATASNGIPQSESITDTFSMSQIQQSLPQPMASMNQSQLEQAKPKTFLGEHSSLVDVDSLLGTGPQKSVPMPGSNPFLVNEPVMATSTPPSVFGTPLAMRPTSQPGNPFAQIQKPKAKSLNELKATNAGYTTGGVGAPLLPAPLIPDSSRPALAPTTIPPQQPQLFMGVAAQPQGMAMGYPQPQQQNPYMTSGW